MPLTSIHDVHNADALEEAYVLADPISQRFEEYIEAQPEDGDTRPGGIHASEISGCQRRLVYSIMNTQRVGKSPYIWKRRFKMGHLIHDMLQTEFASFQMSAQYRVEFEKEVKVSPTLQPVAAQWDINSSCDGIFRIWQKNPELLLLKLGIEIKSMNPDEFERLKAPKPDHIEQAHVYMAALDIPLMWFVYVNKANGNYTKSWDRKFVIPFNPQTWEKLEARFDIAHQNASLNILPEREESILCEFCAFSHTCQPTYLNRQGRTQTLNRRFMK